MTQLLLVSRESNVKNVIMSIFILSNPLLISSVNEHVLDTFRKYREI